MIELTRIDQSSKVKSASDDENSNSQRIRSPRKSSSDSCSSADTEIYEKGEESTSTGGVASEKGDNKPNGKKVKNEDVSKEDNSWSRRISKRENKTYYLTRWELDGLEKLIQWIEDLPVNKKGIPRDMIDAEQVLLDMKVRMIDSVGTVSGDDKENLSRGHGEDRKS